MRQISDYSTFFEDNIAVYSAILFKYACSKGFCTYESEDIAQEAMFIAWSKLKQLRDPDKARAWLFTITNRVILAHYRKANERNYYIIDNSEISMENMASSHSEALHMLELAEARAVLPKLLNQMDEKYRKIIILYYYYDQSLIEISRMTNKNYRTVQTNYYRAIEKMRALYKKYENGELK